MKEIDPTAAPDVRLKRNAFVGLATGAAGAALLAASPQPSELGKPHPPLVPEDDPMVTAERIELGSMHTSLPAYFAKPRSAKVLGGVAIAMHIWGVDTSIRDFARRLAKAGFAAIAPDFFGGNAPSGDGATDYTQFSPLAAKLNKDTVNADLSAAEDYLKQQYPSIKIAALGFCMGGAIALRQTIENSKLLSAGAIFYGKVADFDPSLVRVPIIGSYGERDRGIPADGVRAFFDKLTVPHDLKIYPTAGHAFMDDQRASYVPEAADDAWPRTIAFLTKYLSS